ncbi:MAG TPA: ABC transporter permease subunit, partial [Thermoanaerobaculia bacterium]|nr:ABC transporter permease subunit [Thermoanaerobaculia bacterium]
MAVYEQTYRRYDGPTTSRSTRFLVIPRYAYQRLAGSKFLWALLVAASLLTLGAAVLVYLKHNSRALETLGLQIADILPIDARFFDVWLGIELVIGFLLVLVAGPTLVSMDLSNGALPLYLARPVTRREYVLGKLAVLAAMLSVVTWGFGLLLFGLQAVLEGGGWAFGNLRIAAALVLSSWIWILVLSFLTLALSALIRWPLVVR